MVMNSTEMKLSLKLGDCVRYWCANPASANANAPVRVPWEAPENGYSGVIVGLGEYSAEVRESWDAPLYRVYYRDIVQGK